MGKIKIGRAINGVGINGHEYLLNESNEEMLFDSQEDAITYLKGNGCSDEEIQSYSFL